jgi:3-dehydroquinate dehydratase type I
LTRPSASDRNPGKICLPIIEATTGKAVQALAKAKGLADLVEMRVDYIKNPELEVLFRKREIPCIVTNRRKEEGGRYKGDERSRRGILREAVLLGFEFVDLEWASGKFAIDEVMGKQVKTRLILSHHDFEKTPPLKELRSLCGRMMRHGADVIKIVTSARSWEDNLKVLSLIPYALGKKQAIVALCMGDKGKMSRVFAPLMGAAWTYAPFTGDRASAPGQLTALELKEIWRRLR